jgi:hypothetical protein
MQKIENWQPVSNVQLVSTPPRREQRFFFWSKHTRRICREFSRHYLGLRKPDPDLVLELLEREVARTQRAKKPDTSKREEYFRKLHLLLPGLSRAECEAITQQAKATSFRKRILQTAAHKFALWRPQIDITGASHVNFTTSASKPTIYWIDNTIFAELIGRMAFHQMGIDALHYSDWVDEHGGTWLGRTFLQKPIFKLEQKFIGPRIISTPASHFSSMHAFANAMRNGKSVFSMNNAFLGRRHSCTPLGEDLFLVQATAPMNMAYRYNARLVPVTVIETTPFRRYEVAFHEPLNTSPNLSRDDNIRLMSYLSAQRQIQSIRQTPEQWLCFLGDQIGAPRDGKISRYGM